MLTAKCKCKCWRINDCTTLQANWPLKSGIVSSTLLDVKLPCESPTLHFIQLSSCNGSFLNTIVFFKYGAGDISTMNYVPGPKLRTFSSVWTETTMAVSPLESLWERRHLLRRWCLSRFLDFWNICEDDLEAVGDADVVLGVQEHGQGWKWYNYQGRIPKDL